MGDDSMAYYKAFERPQTISINRNKKRALADKLTTDSPKKRSRGGGSQGGRTPKKKKKPFGAQPPPPDDLNLSNEDSASLFDLFSSKQQSLSRSSISSPDSLPSQQNDGCNSTLHLYFSGNSAPPPTTSSASATKTDCRTQFYTDFIQTPPQQSKKRQKLTPAPIINSNSSPSWLEQNRRPPFRPTKGQISRVNLQGKFADQADSVLGKSESEWQAALCSDWSLKTKFTVISKHPFGFNATGLKSSEESSGTSAFVRCVDIDPSRRGEETISQLDTSLGAQFHQCCLYWQHPTLPCFSLFPRDAGNISFNSVSSNSSPFGGIRMEQKVFDAMFLDWVDAFRSAFQLLRTRLCPYFYVCTNQLTLLFCAAGTQGLDFIRVYITPSSKGFRDALTVEGIEFTTPCATISEEKTDLQNNVDNVKKMQIEKDESDDEPDAADKWLDEMGISQDVSLSHNLKISPGTTADEKNKGALLVIAGATNCMAFFNFLINSKNIIISVTGPFANLPPTILSPVAFHGATMKRLKVKQSKLGKAEFGDVSYTIDASGPILPHVVHMLCPVMKKTTKEFKVRTVPVQSTVNFNLHSQYHSSSSTATPNAFELQNLSDCGLAKGLLDIFCKSDNADTIINLDYKDDQFRWS